MSTEPASRLTGTEAVGQSGVFTRKMSFGEALSTGMSWTATTRKASEIWGEKRCPSCGSQSFDEVEVTPTRSLLKKAPSGEGRWALRRLENVSGSPRQIAPVDQSTPAGRC
jgi:hypothetical protein